MLAAVGGCSQGSQWPSSGGAPGLSKYYLASMEGNGLAARHDCLLHLHLHLYPLAGVFLFCFFPVPASGAALQGPFPHTPPEACVWPRCRPKSESNMMHHGGGALCTAHVPPTWPRQRGSMTPTSREYQKPPSRVLRELGLALVVTNTRVVISV